jgi:hypothetical protein
MHTVRMSWYKASSVDAHHTIQRHPHVYTHIDMFFKALIPLVAFIALFSLSHRSHRNMRTFWDAVMTLGAVTRTTYWPAVGLGMTTRSTLLTLSASG